MLQVEPDRVLVEGVFAGSTVVSFTLGGVTKGATTASLLEKLEALAGAGNISTHFPSYANGGAIEVGEAVAVMDVTFKIASAATMGTDRTVVDLLNDLNTAISGGTLGSLKLPRGQDVFENLRMACPAGTYQNPNEGCVPCDPGSQPTPRQDACIDCAAWSPAPNASSYVSADGRACTLCPGGRSPEEKRIACVDCKPGQAASGLGDPCAVRGHDHGPPLCPLPPFSPFFLSSLPPPCLGLDGWLERSLSPDWLLLLTLNASLLSQPCADRTTVPNADDPTPSSRSTACICPPGSVDTTQLAQGATTVDGEGRCRFCPPGSEAGAAVRAVPPYCSLSLSLSLSPSLSLLCV